MKKEGGFNEIFKGGLKMFFEQNLPFLVVKYNGKILNEKEYELEKIIKESL